MKDRVPTPGQEGRVKITPESGGAAYYAKLEMADNPIQAGDEPIKANLLPDDVATKLGLQGNAQVKDALLRVAPWRLLTIYDVAGAYVFDPADFPGVSEIGAFIIGAGASGTAAIGRDYPSIGGASGRTRAIIRKAPFLTTFSLVVGQGGVAVTTSGNNISGQDGSSSAFDGVTASGGKKGDFNTTESLVPAGGQAPLILGEGPTANVTRPPFAFGEVISTTMGYGGVVRQNPMFPNECLNPFDGKRICIAGGSRYMNSNSGGLVYEESIAITDDYGNTGSVAAYSESGNVIAIKGTSYGCGGGAALAANEGTATSAAGCDGAVLIYGR